MVQMNRTNVMKALYTANVDVPIFLVNLPDFPDSQNGRADFPGFRIFPEKYSNCSVLNIPYITGEVPLYIWEGNLRP